MGEQVEALEDHADILAMLAVLHKTRLLLPLALEVNKWLTVNFDLAVIDLLKAVQQADQRGLTGTGRADDGDDFAGLNLQADRAQHFDIVIGFMQFRRLQRWLLRHADAAGHCRTSRRGQLLHFFIHRARGFTLRDVEPGLETLKQKIKYRDDQDVVKRHRRHGLHDEEILRIEALADH